MIPGIELRWVRRIVRTTSAIQRSLPKALQCEEDSIVMVLQYREVRSGEPKGPWTDVPVVDET